MMNLILKSQIYNELLISQPKVYSFQKNT